MALIPLPLPQPRELPSAGSHLAACQSVIYLGSQPFEWDGKNGSRRQLRLGFEFMDEFMDDARPFLVARTYSYSMHPNAALRADLEGWYGRPFTPAEFGNLDLAEQIGATAVIGINRETGRNGTEYANLASILKPPAGTAARYKLINKPVVLSPTAFDHAVYQALPGWLQQKLAGAPEYASVMWGGSITAEALGKRLHQKLEGPAVVSTRIRKEVRPTQDLDDGIPF